MRIVCFCADNRISFVSYAQSKGHMEAIVKKVDNLFPAGFLLGGIALNRL